MSNVSLCCPVNKLNGRHEKLVSEYYDSVLKYSINKNKIAYVYICKHCGILYANIVDF